jgi:uncharacterized RDD family membrane protein YckC
LNELQSLGLGCDAESVPEGATFWHRALARLIDIVIHNLVSAAAAFPAVGIVAAVAQSTGRDPALLLSRMGGITFIGALASLIGATMYHTLLEGLHGSTVGKRICGLVVVTADQQPCGLRSALGRSAAFYIDSILFGAVAASHMADSRRRQRLGDKWCHTMVMRRAALPAAAVRPGVPLFVVSLLAFSVDGTLLTCLWSIRRSRETLRPDLPLQRTRYARR